MWQQNFKQYAFSLMELLLVLLLISGMLVAGQKIYDKYLLKQSIEVVQQDIQLLFDILDKSYFALSEDERKDSCDKEIHTGIITDDEWRMILSSLLIPQTSGASSHPDFSISCVNPTSDAPAQLIIKSRLNDQYQSELAWYAAKLGGVVDNGFVKWQKIPTYIFGGKDPFWILSGQLAKFKSDFTLPEHSLIMNLDAFSGKTLKVVLSYDDGSGAIQTIEGTTSPSGTVMSQVELPKGSNSITIKGVSIRCNSNGKEISFLGDVGQFYMKNNNINTLIEFNKNVDNYTSFAFSVNFLKVGFFSPEKVLDEYIYGACIY